MELREQAMRSASSIEQLDSALRAPMPKLWMLLVAVLAATLALVLWASFATIPVRVKALAAIQPEDGTYACEFDWDDGIQVRRDMEARIGEEPAVVVSVEPVSDKKIRVALRPVAEGVWDAGLLDFRKKFMQSSVTISQVRPILLLGH
jgi:hypothetical protein